MDEHLDPGMDEQPDPGMDERTQSPEPLLSEPGQSDRAEVQVSELAVKENPSALSIDSQLEPSPILTPRRSPTHNTGKVKPITLCVYTMKEGTKCTMTFPSGKGTTAQQIVDQTFTELGMLSEVQDVFSLWLTSKYLQLQLKPHHLPCKLFKRWKGLLAQYSNLSFEEQAKDEPILSFQRNAFFNLKDERKLLKLNCNKVINFLYHEAVFNVTKSRYPMTKDEFHDLAGLQATIQASDSLDRNPKPSNYLKSITSFYPAHMCPEIQRRVKLFKQKSTEGRDTADLFAKSMTAVCAKSYDSHQLKVLYLQICWHKSFYGSVFFRGQMKKAFKAVHLLTSTDQFLTVAINADSFHLFSVATQPETLLFLTFDQLSWELQIPEEDSDDVDSSLWVEFDSVVSEGGDEKKVAKRIQVFSRQAPMMDVMVTRCVADIDKREEGLRQLRVQQGNQEFLPDVSIKTPCAPGESPRIQRQERNYKENKLGCEVFNEDGSQASNVTLSRVLKKRKAPKQQQQQQQQQEESMFVMNPSADEEQLNPSSPPEASKLTRQDSNGSITTGL